MWEWSQEEEPTYRPPPKRKPHRSCYCPVCPKEYLGIQEEGMEVSLHCPDCRAWYTFFPGVDKPMSKLDKDVPKVCNCLACRGRRGEED